MKILVKVKWDCDPEGMFHPPSLAKGSPVRLECEQLATQLGVLVQNVSEELMLAARIHHFVAVCGAEAQEYFLSGHCPLDSKKIALLSRRMPPFIRSKLKTLLTGSVNVVSNPDHAFDTDGWPELKGRLPKFRATMEYYAIHCIGTLIQSKLTGSEIERLSEKLRLIQHECDLIEQKLRSTQPQGKSSSHRPPAVPKSKPKPDWLKAYGRIAQVHGVLQKTNRDLNSQFWKPEWIPSEAQLDGVIADVRAINQAATTIRIWLRR